MKERHEVGAKAVNRYFLILTAILTAGIIVSLGWNIYQLKQSILTIAQTSAEISHNKDFIYRMWVAKKGGVYAPLSEVTPPNPYLTVPMRDVETTDGLRLTLINPAYMTRQVNEMTKKKTNFLGHITSLNPIRPENSPDPWERESLKSFEGGAKETASLEKISGKEFFRFMRPLCHRKVLSKVPCIPGIQGRRYPWRHKFIDTHGISQGHRKKARKPVGACPRLLMDHRYNRHRNRNTTIANPDAQA